MAIFVISQLYKAKDNRRAISYFGKNTSTAKYLEYSELGAKVSENLFL